MKEAELLELVFIAGATAMTAFNFVVTFTFAYLTVAYFLGSRLSRLEAGMPVNYLLSAVTCLFFMWNIRRLKSERLA